MLNIVPVTTITKSIEDYFNDYPCEWRASIDWPEWSLFYKTGDIIAWIERPDSPQEAFTATFSPQGWESVRSDNAQQQTLTLEEAKSWVQLRFLKFLYPEGWQFSG